MASSEEREMVLFLVDDDKGTRIELGRILQHRTGFKVLTMASPSETLKQADKVLPDVALIDLRLPEMSGLELLAALRKKKGAENLMAIIMTGYGEPGSARKARESGATDFIEKPLDLPYLLVVLRQMEREARLRKNLMISSELFSGFLNMIPDGTVMTDSAGTVLFSNKLGKELMARGYDRPGNQHRVNGRVYTLEKNSSGNRVLWHWIDLTASLERERVRAYREMARHMAHEVRNPLTPIRLWLQELESLSPDNPEYATTAVKAVKVLSGQVNRMVTLLERFKILGDDKEIVIGPVEVSTLFTEVAEALRPLAAKKDVRITQPERGSWTVKAEETSLYQCLFNALRNAIEASPPSGGEVLLEAEAKGRDIEIRIVDNAGGLPPEVAADPFTPYLTTKKDGTGLGLLVSRELAERMGGKLKLENRSGEGATVVLTFESS